MIYLILSAEVEIIDKGRGEFRYSPLLKIGYTRDINSRFDSYLLHNPGCKLLGTREGDTELESYFHSYYSQYKYPERDREWFIYSQEIVDNFQTLQVGDNWFTKEEYIKGLREYIRSNISTPQELKEKYLEDLLREIENTKSEVEFDRDFHKQFTISFWEEWYEKEMGYIDSFDFYDLLKEFPERINLRENPWKNSATFYYRVTADYKKMDGEDFQRIIQTKREKTESLLRTYGVALDKDKQVLAEKYQSDSKNCNYRRDYVAVDNIGVSLVPVLNNLVMVNEIRAFKIQQIDYADRFAVFSTIHNKLTKDDTINQEASQFLEEYRSLTEARKKMILLCESSINGRLSKEAIQMVLDQIPDSDYIKGYYQSLGPEKLKNLGYKRNNIEKALGVVVFSPELLLDSVYSSFKVGDKLELSKIKACLESLYESINYNKTPKAKDLLDYFESKLVYISVVDESTGKKKQTKGYELLRSKEHELRQELKLAE